MTLHNEGVYTVSDMAKELSLKEFLDAMRTWKLEIKRVGVAGIECQNEQCLCGCDVVAHSINHDNTLIWCNTRGCKCIIDLRDNTNIRCIHTDFDICYCGCPKCKLNCIIDGREK